VTFKTITNSISPANLLFVFVFQLQALNFMNLSNKYVASFAKVPKYSEIKIQRISQKITGRIPR